MHNREVFIRDTNSAGIESTREFFSKFLDAIRKKGLNEQVLMVRSSDMGIYKKGMVVKILPDNIIYQNVQEADIERIVNETLLANRVIEELRYKVGPAQMRIVLRNCGKIDPDSLEDYLKVGGYQGLKKVLFDMTPENVINDLKKAGLRGRGGAGYPTWMKWNITKNIKVPEKFIICNADEGDPGAYMDRSILESDPHSVMEGLIIAGRTCGATRGFFYVRAEYPLAVERVKRTIENCYESGLLGKNILGSDFSFDAEIRLGAGAFVCGEETALIASIEGKRGTPKPRPPYPSVRGLWDKPTVINNVETLANVSVIFSRGSEALSRIGTATSKGTKVFAVTGKVKNSGLVEVPMGTTLAQIVYETCGGTRSEKEVKAVQTGGPSGGVIPKAFLDTPVDYENLQKLGSIMGSGGMIVMDTDDCMVDIAKFYQQFCVDESCGKCAPCRIGSFQLLNILKNITTGKGKMEDLTTLRRISKAMQKASLCGLGQSAPNPVLSTLKYFEEEYKEHILNKKCRAGKCTALLNFSIIQDKCKRCAVCVRNCPSFAISGDREKGFVIDQQKCTKCSSCLEVCKFKAIRKE